MVKTSALIGDQILFLDIATRTGWCVGVPGAVPSSGTFRLGRTGAKDAEVFGSMLAWLGGLLTEGRFARVIFEAPVGPGMAGKTNFSTMRRLNGLCAIAEAVCHQTGHPVFQASAASIRKVVLGNGRPENPKAAVMAEIRARGFDPADDNEADAISGWLYACEMAERNDPPLLRRARGSK